MKNSEKQDNSTDQKKQSIQDGYKDKTWTLRRDEQFQKCRQNDVTRRLYDNIKIFKN